MALARKSQLWRWATVATLVVSAAMAGGGGAGGAPTPPAGAAEGAVVATDAGPVRGTIGEGYRLFQGIPYAAPPVGDRRWRAPQPPEPWAQPIEATASGNRCPQAASPYGGAASDTEDCLYLDVTTPAGATADRQKPVMVWLHGGGLVGGAGSDYDARRLADAGDVVVVTVNYRLGVFGFFAYPGLEDSGSFGFLDQQAALRWVQRNIAAFGGDPGNVTLFGESAGGFSGCAHLASPSAAGLFDRAILQSGSCLGDWPAGTLPGVPTLPPWPPLAQNEATGAAVAAETGCSREDPARALDCLRQRPVGELLPAGVLFAIASYGTSVLPENPETVLREGRFHPVPILSGHTLDEGTIWASFQPQPITASGYRALLDGAFGGAADEVGAEYPLAGYATPGLAWAAVISDRVGACPTLQGHRLFAAQVPTFVYRFDDRGAPVVFPEPPEIPLGAYHGADVPYLFDADLGEARSAALPPEQRRLADRMIGYWANFARGGDPNGAGLPEWPRFVAGDPVPFVQGLAPRSGGIGPVDVAAEHRCGFWGALDSTG